MKDCYIDFLTQIEKKFTTDSSELHYINGVALSTLNVLTVNEEVLNRYNPLILKQLKDSIEKSTNVFNEKLLEYLAHYKDIKILILKLLSTINKLASLKKRLGIYTVLYSLSEKDYTTITSLYGEVLSTQLVLTGKTKLPAKLGVIEIYLTDNTQSKIDWGESNRIKQRIIDEGGIPKDINNPNGEKWIVKHTKEQYVYVKYVYNKMIYNLQHYKFKASNFNNCTRDGIIEVTPRSVEECLRTKYGLLQKILRYMSYDINAKFNYKLTNEKNK